MRLLLCQPPEGSTFGVSKMFLPEPLAIELVAGSLTADGHDIRIIDMRLEPWRALESMLRSFKPHAVGISCAYTSEVMRIREMTVVVRAVCPEAFLFLGGHDVTRTPTHYNHEHADAVVMGEGEWCTPELLRTVEGGGDIGGISGVARMTDKGAVRNEKMPEYQNMDLLPLPRRDLVERYRQRYYIGFQRPVYSVETTRGCPYTCNFCSVWEMYERTYRGRSPDKVVEDLSRAPGPEIFFVDDLFFLDAKRAIAMAEAIQKSGLRRRYTAQIRADSVARHPEIVEIWRSIGLNRVFVGMEATDDEGLKKVEKKAKIESTEKAIRLLADAGIEIQGSFIAHPDWTREDFTKLVDFMKSHPIRLASFSVLTPLPGTKLHRERVHEITDHDPELYDVFHAVLPTTLTLEEFYEEFAGLYRRCYSTKRYAEMLPGIWNAMRRGDLLHAIRVMWNLSHMRRPSSYQIAHKHAAERARRLGPAKPAPIVSETHKRTAAERLISLQRASSGPIDQAQL